MRCSWVAENCDVYARYHDEEWGRPLHNEQKLFEMLILESFQAGLSWECILNKRLSFKEAYDNFDIEKVINYDDEKIEEPKKVSPQLEENVEDKEEMSSILPQYDDNEDTYDLQKELEAKFDELFGPLDDEE